MVGKRVQREHEVMGVASREQPWRLLLPSTLVVLLVEAMNRLDLSSDMALSNRDSNTKANELLYSR